MPASGGWGAGEHAGAPGLQWGLNKEQDVIHQQLPASPEPSGEENAGKEPGAQLAERQLCQRRFTTSTRFSSASCGSQFPFFRRGNRLRAGPNLPKVMRESAGIPPNSVSLHRTLDAVRTLMSSARTPGAWLTLSLWDRTQHCH